MTEVRVPARVPAGPTPALASDRRADSDHWHDDRGPVAYGTGVPRLNAGPASGAGADELPIGAAAAPRLLSLTRGTMIMFTM